MPWHPVKPILLGPDDDVRDPEVSPCLREYPGHARGCPNWGKRETCPPAAPLLWDVLDPGLPVFAVWNVFALGTHTRRMRKRHPDWSDRQCACCLYWQPRARKQLEEHIRSFQGRIGISPARVLRVPEANGVNVTETMRSVGIELEWPPKILAYQVALVGTWKRGGQ